MRFTVWKNGPPRAPTIRGFANSRPITPMPTPGAPSLAKRIARKANRSQSESLAKRIARKETGDYDGLIADAQKAASLNVEYATLLDDARSTVLYRRALLVFLLLGAVLLALGAIPFFKSLAKLIKAG